MSHFRKFAAVLMHFLTRLSPATGSRFLSR